MDVGIDGVSVLGERQFRVGSAVSMVVVESIPLYLSPHKQVDLGLIDSRARIIARNAPKVLLLYVTLDHARK